MSRTSPRIDSPVVSASDLRELYEREARTVDRYDGSSFWDRRYHRERFGAIERILGSMLRRGDAFLDAGCGSGEYLNAALEAGAGVAVGVDLSFGYCRRASGVSDQARALQADATVLPFRSRAFDVVLCSEVIEHVPPHACRAAVDELMRVTRRSIILTTPNRRAVIRRLARRINPSRVEALDAEVGHINLLTVDELQRMLNRVDWASERPRGMHVLPPVVGEDLRLPASTTRMVRTAERLATKLAPGSGNALIAIAHRQR